MARPLPRLRLAEPPVEARDEGLPTHRPRDRLFQRVAARTGPRDRAGPPEPGRAVAGSRAATGPGGGRGRRHGPTPRNLRVDRPKRAATRAQAARGAGRTREEGGRVADRTPPRWGASGTDF